MRRRRFLCVILLAVAIMIICSACGQKKDDNVSEKDMSSRDIVERLMDDIGDSDINTVVSYGDKKYKENFEYLYGFSMDKISDGAIAYAKKGKSADEISLVRVKDSKDVKGISEILKKRIERRKRNFRGYEQDEVTKLGKAQVISKGNYVILIICDNLSIVKQEFKSAVS